MPRRASPVKNSPDKGESLGRGLPFLREVRRGTAHASPEFPFSVPVIRALDVLAFPTPVTFFVGENGSGKSTLLEGIASAAGLPAAGSADVGADATLDAQRALGRALRLVWNRRTHRVMFGRARCSRRAGR